LAITIADNRPDNGSSQAQPNGPTTGQPFEKPSNEKRDYPETANQSVTDRNTTDEETVLTAISEFAQRAFLKTMKQIPEDGTSPATRTTVHHGSPKVKKFHDNGKGAML